MEEILNKILQEISEMKGHMAPTDQKIEQMSTTFHEEFDNVRNKMSSMEHGLKEEIGNVCTELKEGRKRLEMKLMSIPENYEHLENFSARQQRTIELLSERSIRHEAISNI